MKKNEYIIENSKIIDDKNIAICADLHLSSHTKKEKLREVLDALEEIKPTHIVIPGDLYNVDDMTIGKGKNMVSDFTNQMTEIAEVYYVQGNSEQRSKKLPSEFYLAGNKKFHLLCEHMIRGKTNSISDIDMTISALKLPDSFYQLDENERYQQLVLKKLIYLRRLSNSLDPKMFQVLLCHDPIIESVFMYWQLELKKQNPFDLIISGHNHGGLFPSWMRPFLEFSKINISNAYPTYVKGIIKHKDNYHIISEGITKFHSESGKLERLEQFHEGTIENVKVLRKRK